MFSRGTIVAIVAVCFAVVTMYVETYVKAPHSEKT
jgi:hypothetical protein